MIVIQSGKEVQNTFLSGCFLGVIFMLGVAVMIVIWNGKFNKNTPEKSSNKGNYNLPDQHSLERSQKDERRSLEKRNWGDDKPSKKDYSRDRNVPKNQLPEKKLQREERESNYYRNNGDDNPLGHPQVIDPDDLYKYRNAQRLRDTEPRSSSDGDRGGWGRY